MRNDLRDGIENNYLGAGPVAAAANGGSGGAPSAAATGRPSGAAAGAGGRAPVASAGEAGAAGASMVADNGNGTASGAGGSSMAAAGAAGAGSSAQPAAGPSAACDGFAVLEANCGTSGCHGAGSNLGNFAESEAIARSFAGKDGAVCRVAPIIDPEDPANSLMLQKLSDDPPCGQPMPAGGSPLEQADIDCLEDWIGSLQ